MRPDEIRKIADAARKMQIRTSQTEDPNSIILALERRLGDELPQKYVDAILFASNPEEMSMAANEALSFIERGGLEDMWKGERDKFLPPEIKRYLDNPGLYDELPSHERLKQDFESQPDLRGKINAIMAGNHQLFGKQGIQPGGDRFEKEAVNWQDVKGFFGNLFNPKGTEQLMKTPAQSKLPMDANGNFDGRAYYGERYDSDPTGLANSTDWSQYGAKAQNAQQAQSLGAQQYASYGDPSKGYTKSKDGTTVPAADYERGYAAGIQLQPKVKSINVPGFQQVNNRTNYAPPPPNETQGYQKGWMDALASNSKKRKITAGRIPYDLLVDLRTLLEPYAAQFEHGVAGRGWRRIVKEATDLVKRMAPGIRNPEAFVHAFVVHMDEENPDYEDAELSPEIQTEWETRRNSDDFKDRRRVWEYPNERTTYDRFPDHSAEETSAILDGYQRWQENDQNFDEDFDDEAYQRRLRGMTRDEIIALSNEEDRRDYDRYLRSLQQKTAGAKEIIRDRKGTPEKSESPEEEEPTVLETLRKHRRLDPNSTRTFPAKVLAQEIPDPDVQGPELDEEIPEEMDDPKDLTARIDSLLDAMDGDPDREIAQIALKLVQRLDKAIREPYDQQEAEARSLDNDQNEMAPYDESGGIPTRTASFGIDHHTTGVVDHLRTKSVEELETLLEQADEKIALDPQPRYMIARDHIVQALEAHGIRIS